MASGRPLNILSSLDEAEEWHKQPYIRGLPKKFKPFGLDPPPLTSGHGTTARDPLGWVLFLQSTRDSIRRIYICINK